MNIIKKFTEKELLEEIVCQSIFTKFGENRRWSRSNLSIINIDNKYYGVRWNEGLTENQSHKIYNTDITSEMEMISIEITTIRLGKKKKYNEWIYKNDKDYQNYILKNGGEKNE